jgi:hypothetical protein
MKNVNNKKYKFKMRGNDFYIALGDFLDEFYKADRFKKTEMINNLIVPLAGASEQENCFFAATIHKLANDYDITPPSWVFNEEYYLDFSEPFFTGNAKGKLRQYLMYTSPPEFKHRNMFVDANVLMRV